MENNIKNIILSALVFLLQFIFAQDWELTMTAQDVEQEGSEDYIRVGYCDGCHDGFHFGEDEYDLPNGGNTYTDIQILNYDWLGDEDTNGNSCDNPNFYVDKHSLHEPEHLTEWLISGSTYNLPQNTSILLTWSIENPIDDIDIFLYIGDIGYDMKNQSSLIVNSSELYTEFDFETYSELVNIKILSGGCASVGTTTYYFDEDEDGLGCGTPQQYCPGFQPDSWVNNNNDEGECACTTNNTDSCGVCDGGNVNDLGCGCFEPAPSGCDNTCGSVLEFDDCGVCDGGNLNDLGCGCFEPAPSGCDNVCGSNLEIDDCGICGGNNIDMDDCGECNESNQSCIEQIFGDGPQNFSAFINDANIELTWDHPNYPLENGIMGFNIYIQNGLMEFIASTFEESFTVNNYNEGIFCLSAYDQFDNESNYTCTEASGMLTMQFELLHEANLISFMGIPIDSSIINIFNPLGDNITGVIGQGTASNNLGNDSWVGSLTMLEPTSGYWIKLNDPPVESFIVEAYPTNPNINYDLMEGQNLISYVGIDNLPISDAIPDEYESNFMGIIGQGMASIQFSSGNWGGSLVELNNLAGYWVQIETAMNFHWNINEELIRESTPKTIIKRPIPDEFIYSQSTQQAFYFVEDIDVNNYELSEQDWLIAYYNNIVIGARQWGGKYSDIPTMGIDDSDETFDYIEEGMIPNFKLLKESTGELLILDADSINPWMNNGLTFVTLYAQDESINPNIPISSIIEGAYPNPFNPISTIKFSLNEDCKIQLSIHNVNGEKVEDLYSGYKGAGFHQIVWDAKDMPSGMYFFTLNIPNGIHSQKLLLLK